MPSADIPGFNGGPSVAFPVTSPVVASVPTVNPVVASVPTVDPVSVATIPGVPGFLSGLVLDGTSVTAETTVRAQRADAANRASMGAPRTTAVLFSD